MKLAVACTAGFATLIAFAGFVAFIAGNSSTVDASHHARVDIPPAAMSAYLAAADACPGLSWPVIAAIGKIETDHARHGGARIAADGTVRPRIIGIPLNGSNATRAITDTDGGRWDGDTTWDRAVGPMQFIPSTWRAYQAAGNTNGPADPHNINHATRAAAAYLCANGANDPARLRAAILAYNHDGVYADEVLATAAAYTLSEPGGGSGGLYALPVDRELLSVPLLRRPHHSYPAWDLAVPVGTPVYAVRGGDVTVATDLRCGRGITIAGDDGARYTYCHASLVLVPSGLNVPAGHPILLSGNTGHSTGPHLHLQIRNAHGQLICPQPLLQSWYHGFPGSPNDAPTRGCIS